MMSMSKQFFGACFAHFRITQARYCLDFQKTPFNLYNSMVFLVRNSYLILCSIGMIDQDTMNIEQKKALGYLVYVFLHNLYRRLFLPKTKELYMPHLFNSFRDSFDPISEFRL